MPNKNTKNDGIINGTNFKNYVSKFYEKIPNIIVNYNPINLHTKQIHNPFMGNKSLI